MDPFKNCVTNRHRYCATTELLAKSVGIYVLKIPRWKSMKSVRSILSLQQSTSKLELLELLRALTVLKLKLLCKESVTKTSGTRPILSDDWYDVEGSVRRCSRDVRNKRSRNHRHACVQRTSFVDEGPIAGDTFHLHAAVPLFGPQQGENVR